MGCDCIQANRKQFETDEEMLKIQLVAISKAIFLEAIFPSTLKDIKIMNH